MTQNRRKSPQCGHDTDEELMSCNGLFPMPETIKNLKVVNIRIGQRFRTDLGDLKELVESVRHGLLQSIGVTPQRELVFGFRRLLAHRDILKHKTSGPMLQDCVVGNRYRSVPKRKKGSVMIRKVVNLVRIKENEEVIEAVVESPVGVDLANDTNLPALWSCLIGHRITPTQSGEMDQGIRVFPSDLDPRKHAHLPVVNLNSLGETVPLPRTLPAVNSEHPRRRRLTVRNTVTLTRRVEEYEVKRMIVQASSKKEIEVASGDELWWGSPQVPVEADEHQNEELTIDIDTYHAQQHMRLPFVSLDAAPSATKLEPPNTFLCNWQPTLVPFKKDVAESLRTAKLIEAESKQCWFNARSVIRSLPEYSDASYVEGYVVSDQNDLIEHGWLVQNDSVVDPTLPTDDVVYFPGLEFRGRHQIRDFLRTDYGRQSNGHPFHWAFGISGRKSPAFRAAFDKAIEHQFAKQGRTPEKAPPRGKRRTRLPRSQR